MIKKIGKTAKDTKPKSSAKKPKATMNRKMPNSVADNIDSAFASLFAEKFYQFLHESSANSYSHYEEVEPENQIIDMEAHVREMNDAFFNAVNGSSFHVLLILSENYAIVGQKVNLGVQLSRGQKSFQPLEEIKRQQMCLVKVFCWSDGAKEDQLVQRAVRMGAPLIDIYVVEEIKDKLGI